MMPWRRDTEHESDTLAEYPTAEIVFCHSEVRGIYLNNKVKNMHGSDANTFSKYTAVYSGHIHYRQTKGALRMVGTPYELTRSDSGNTKGFDMVDLETMEETFFENRLSPKFVKFNLTTLYNTTLGDFKQHIDNNFVDLFVPSKIATHASLSALINRVQRVAKKLEPNIYQEQDIIDKDLHDMEEIEGEFKSYNILHLFDSYVDALSHDKEMKQKIKDELKNVYNKVVNNYDVDQ